jgi:hypothetical protein
VLNKLETEGASAKSILQESIFEQHRNQDSRRKFESWWSFNNVPDWRELPYFFAYFFAAARPSIALLFCCGAAVDAPVPADRPGRAEADFRARPAGRVKQTIIETQFERLLK